MPSQGISKRFSVCLFAVLLMGAAAGVSYGEGCWVLSGSINPYPISPYPICQSGKVCVEWDVGGQAVSYTCCGQEPSYCENPCSSSASRPVPFRIDVLPEAPLKDNEDLRHEVPAIPILVDQTAFAPAEIRHFDGVPLYFLACRNRSGQPLFQAFTTKEGFRGQLRECAVGTPSSVVKEAPAKAAGGIVFFEGRRWSGAPYFLAGGQSLDLSDTWWDERISSLRGFGSGTLVTFFENADFSGSSLTLATDLAWPNLGIFGWDARASALVVWPTLADHKPTQKAVTGR